MEAQTFEEGLYTSDGAEPTDPGTEALVFIDMGPVAAETPLDAEPPRETPMDETIPHQVPLDAAPLPETPLGETIRHEAPLDAAPLPETPMGETIRYELDAVLPPETPMGETIRYELDAILPPETPRGETMTMPHEAPTDAAVLPETPMGEIFNQKAALYTNAGPPEALLSLVDSEHFRTRWSQIQGKFVDEPRSAVQQADALVAEVIEQITQLFANESNSLEAQWKEGSDVSTEDLRQALQHYRSFFNRLMV